MCVCVGGGVSSFEQLKHQLNVSACLYSAIKRKTVKENITIDTVLLRVIQKHKRERCFVTTLILLSVIVTTGKLNVAVYSHWALYVYTDYLPQCHLSHVIKLVLTEKASEQTLDSLWYYS